MFSKITDAARGSLNQLKFWNKVQEEVKWHKNNLREDAQKIIANCTMRLEDGVGEGVFVMTPPTDEEHEAYFLAKLNVYFDIWASTWSR